MHRPQLSTGHQWRRLARSGLAVRSGRPSAEGEEGPRTAAACRLAVPAWLVTSGWARRRRMGRVPREGTTLERRWRDEDQVRIGRSAPPRCVSSRWADSRILPMSSRCQCSMSPAFWAATSILVCTSMCECSSNPSAFWEIEQPWPIWRYSECMGELYRSPTPSSSPRVEASTYYPVHPELVISSAILPEMLVLCWFLTCEGDVES